MSQLKKALLSSLLILLSLLFSLLLAEVLSRIVMPISPGVQKLSLQGEELSISAVAPGAVYRQVSSEFDAETTITNNGYRIPELSSNPDIVFLGDSFTFGHGVSDKDTFVYKYCVDKNLQCANLGLPGSGTGEQLDRLEKYLSKEAWRPAQVKLFMFVMTSYLGFGNDLSDNLNYVPPNKSKINRNDSNKKRKKKKPSHNKKSKGGVVDIGQYLLVHSNLVRLGKYNFGPMLKTIFSPQVESSKLDKALGRTSVQLARLDALAGEFGFSYQVYLLHPVQDITRNTYTQTTNTLLSLAESSGLKGETRSTAEFFLNEPQSYYFPYDGHFNEKGMSKIYDMLIEER